MAEHSASFDKRGECTTTMSAMDESMTGQCPSDDQVTSSVIMQQESPLLKLPAELKNYIFELALGSHDTVMLYVKHHPANDTAKSRLEFRPSLPAITKVCRQLRHEVSMDAYYANNTFVFSDSTFNARVLSVFKAIREPSASQMKRVKVYNSQVLRKDSDNAPCTISIRFSAEIVDSARVEITDVRTKGIETYAGQYRAREGICCYFIEKLFRIEQGVLDLVMDYDREMKSMSIAHGDICETCNRLQGECTFRKPRRCSRDIG